MDSIERMTLISVKTTLYPWVLIIKTPMAPIMLPFLLALIVALAVFVPCYSLRGT